MEGVAGADRTALPEAGTPEPAAVPAAAEAAHSLSAAVVCVEQPAMEEA